MVKGSWLADAFGLWRSGSSAILAQRKLRGFRLHFGNDAGIWGLGHPGLGLRFRDRGLGLRAWGREVSA